MKRTKPGNHSLSQASIELCSPKHKSQMFQLIPHHSTNGDVHRLSIGFTTCKLAGGASNSWEAWWLAAYCWGIEDSDRLQKICPDVRMSFHGSIIALKWILDDILLSVFNHCLNVAWYESMPSSLDFAFRRQGPEVPSMQRLPRRSEWEVEINLCWWSWTGFRDFYGFVTSTLILLCISKSMETI